MEIIHTAHTRIFICAYPLDTTCESTALTFRMPEEFKLDNVAHRTTAYATLQKDN